MPGRGRRGARRRGELGASGSASPVLVTSSATGQGLDDAAAASCCGACPVAEPLPEAAGEDEVAEFQVFRPAAARAFEVERTGDGAFRVTGDAVDRLIARHDLENEEALAHVEHRLRRMGVIAALEAEGFEPGDDVELGGVVFELDPSLSSGRVMPRRRRQAGLVDRRRATRASCACPSSRGSARRSPRCTARASTSSSSPAARSRAGCTLLGMGTRPAAVEDLQAASAVGQGRLYRTYDELLRERGVQTAQVLLTFFDVSARTHYLNARRTLHKLLDWRIVPVINENDTTTTDEISFGDNDFLAAQVAVLVGADLLVLLTDTEGVYTADPRADAGARAGRRGHATRRSSPTCRSGTRRRRSGPAACARRSWRPRWRPRPGSAA